MGGLSSVYKLMNKINHEVLPPAKIDKIYLELGRLKNRGIRGP